MDFFSSHTGHQDSAANKKADKIIGLEDFCKEAPTQQYSLETIGKAIDEYVLKRAVVFSLILLTCCIGIVGFLLSLFYGPLYLMALSFGLVLLSLLFFYSLLIYCKEEINDLHHTAEISLIASCHDETHRNNDERLLIGEDAGEKMIKASLSLQKRWYLLFSPTYPKWYFNVLCHTIKPIASMYAWIPYTYFVEKLLNSAKKWYIAQIRQKPKDMKLHAALANNYVTLSNHLREAFDMREELPLKGKLLPKKLYSYLLHQHEAASKRAIQELLILRSFAPDELWVLDQLAISFRELGLIDQEKEIYEAILSIHPDDTNAIFRLGTISFQRGDNAKGLEMYDLLLFLQPLLAQELITSFGAYDLIE